MENYIELREINKLIKEKFYIPTYQRGYRWAAASDNFLFASLVSGGKRKTNGRMGI